MTQGFEFKNLDANNISDNFLKQLKQNKQNKSEEPFENFYNEALDSEQSKSKNLESVYKPALTPQDSQEKTLSELPKDTSDPKGEEPVSHTDEPVVSKEDLKVINQMNFAQFNLQITQNLPKDLRALMSQIVDVVKANPEQDTYEFKAKQADVNIKFQKESDQQLTIKIVLGDADIQQQLNKSLVDEMQNHLRLIFNYDEIDLQIVDPNEALLFQSSGDKKGNQQDEQETSDDKNEDNSTDDIS